MFKLDKSSNYVLRLISVVNIKFPPATYHAIVPSTEELYYLNSLFQTSRAKFTGCTRSLCEQNAISKLKVDTFSIKKSG